MGRRLAGLAVAVVVAAGCSSSSKPAPPVATMTTGTVCPQVGGCGGTTFEPLCGSIGAPAKPPGCHT